MKLCPEQKRRRGLLASGLIKGIGPKTAADIVERFGVDTLDILEHQPGGCWRSGALRKSKLEDIKASYAENRMLQGIMTLLAPFKITPKTALKIYQYFGPTSVEIFGKRAHLSFARSPALDFGG